MEVSVLETRLSCVRSSVEVQGIKDWLEKLRGIDFTKLLDIIEKVLALFGQGGIIGGTGPSTLRVSTSAPEYAELEKEVQALGFDFATILAIIKLLLELFRKPAPAPAP